MFHETAAVRSTGTEDGHFRTTKRGKQKRSLEYNSFLSMRYRCLDPKATSWKDYGGRGIKICDRWLGPEGFVHFLEDLGLCSFSLKWREGALR